MTLHTVISYHDIYFKESETELHYTNRKNGFVSLVNISGCLYVNSLFSTNPYDYLNPGLRPGSKYKG